MAMNLPLDFTKDDDLREQLPAIQVPGKARTRATESIREAFGLALAGQKQKVQDTPLVSMKRLKVDSTPLATSSLQSEAKETTPLPQNTVTMKSTKADNASVPTYLWDDWCLGYKSLQSLHRNAACKALTVLREKFLLCFWKRKVARDFRKWIRDSNASLWWQNPEEHKTSILAGLKAIRYANEASWWEWDGGSFPFFWRWNPEFIRDVRDGILPRFTGNPLACKDRQRPNANPEYAAKEHL